MIHNSVYCDLCDQIISMKDDNKIHSGMIHANGDYQTWVDEHGVTKHICKSCYAVVYRANMIGFASFDIDKLAEQNGIPIARFEGVIGVREL